MKTFGRIFVLLATALAAPSCDFLSDGPDRPESGRRYSDVAIIYTAGYNNLKNDLERNLETVYGSALPMKSSDKALLHFEHSSVSSSDYSTPTAPHLVRISSDWNGNPVLDTLLTLEKGTMTTDAEVMRKVFVYIRDHFESDRYGVLFSSHGTGWLPEGYYSETASADSYMTMSQTRSFGCEARIEHGKTVSHEMNIMDLAAGIPFKLDYIIFDACLMGCVEVAYELRNCTDEIGFSQTEVVSSGFNYKTFTRRFLLNSSPVDFCRDYFRMYSESYDKSATVSLVRCAGLENLATLCATLFERYRQGIDAADPDAIQTFCRLDPYWMYDLEDILLKSGISDTDHAKLRAALDGCIPYAAATKSFRELKINTNCGLSMFLPSTDRNPQLVEFYKSLEWNKATNLVE